MQGRVCLLVHPCASGTCPLLLAYREARHCVNTFSQSKKFGIIQGRQSMHQHRHTSASSAEARAFMRLTIHRTQHPMHRHVHSYSGGCNAWEQGRASRTCTGSPRPCRRRCLMTEAKAQRAVVLLPGLGNSSKDYQAVGEALESRGLHVQVAKLLLSESSQHYVPWTPQDLALLVKGRSSLNLRSNVPARSAQHASGLRHCLLPCSAQQLLAWTGCGTQQACAR